MGDIIGEKHGFGEWRYWMEGEGEGGMGVCVCMYGEKKNEEKSEGES